MKIQVVRVATLFIIDYTAGRMLSGTSGGTLNILCHWKDEIIYQQNVWTGSLNNSAWWD